MSRNDCDLKSCFLCRFCLPEWKDAILSKKTTLSFKKGKEIFREGERVKGIFFIYSGSVKVYTQWTGQKELILRFAKAGDILGHRGIGANDIYPIGASAMEDSRVCFIPNDFLEATFKVDPSFTHRLMLFYAAELQKAEKRMRDLAHMEAKGRIALALLEIAEMYGRDKEKYIALPVNRQDIASYAGTTYETIFKFFTVLIKANIISVSGKKIKINNPKRLQQFVTGKTTSRHRK
ncbi:MAG: Crp/Fnr family transcriptional regulator [Bacteroidota bacterium]|nr:Crp/Fnr family transcriptional regulator [Bacteroidota bacterium]